jgi:hypothetical protein
MGRPDFSREVESQIQKLKRSFSKSLWVLVIGVALTLSLGFAFASNWGQSLLRNEIRKTFARDYSIALDYSSLKMWPGSSGLVIALRDVQLAYVPMLPHSTALSDPIDSIKISLNPLQIFSGLPAFTKIELSGAKISFTLKNNKIQINGLQRSFTPDDASELLARFMEPSKDKDKKFPLFIFKSIALDLSYAGPSEEDAQSSHAQIDFDLTSTKEGGVDSLFLKTEHFDFVKFAQVLDAYLQGMKGVDAYLAKRSWLEVVLSGEINKLNLRCENFPSCEGIANLQHFKTKQDNWIPGIDKLDADLQWKDKVLHIAAADSVKVLNWNKLYAEPLKIATQSLKIDLAFLEKNLQIKIPQTILGYNDVNADLNAAIDIPFEKPSDTTLHYDAKAAATDWQKVVAVLPDAIIGDKTMSWLSKNIKQAKITAVESHGRGSARDFGTVGDVKGYFTIDAAIADVTLNYLKGWPILNACEGKFGMKNLRIDINTLKCKSMQVTVSKGSVVFPNLTAKPPYINIDFEAAGTFEQSLAYLKASPLLSVGKVLDVLGVKASEQTTNISIKAPLGKKDEQNKLSVEGTTIATQAAIDTPVGLYSGKAKRIDVAFDQSGLKNLKGLLQSDFESSSLIIERSKKSDSLEIQLQPVKAATDSLRATASLSPARGPSRIRGSAENIKLKNLSAIAQVEDLDWTLGDASLLKVRGRGELRDLGAASQNFGVPDILNDGKGTILYDLSLSNIGKQPILNALGGTLNIDAKDGTVNRLPGWAATVVNAANLESFKGGDKLPYKELKADLAFDKGTLSVKRSSLNAGVIEVQGQGTVNFAVSQMNLNLKFVPDLGSAPTALAIGIWNPFLGAALFGVSQYDDRASDSFLNRLAAQTYKLEGSTKDPKVSLVKLFELKDAFR